MKVQPPWIFSISLRTKKLAPLSVTPSRCTSHRLPLGNRPLPQRALEVDPISAACEVKRAPALHLRRRRRARLRLLARTDTCDQRRSTGRSFRKASSVNTRSKTNAATSNSFSEKIKTRLCLDEVVTQLRRRNLCLRTSRSAFRSCSGKRHMRHMITRR